MATDAEKIKEAKRRLLFRDSLVFLSLLAVTAVLFAVTLFLFRSFQVRRGELAEEWAAKGLAAYQAHKPEAAITAYRTALSYAPAGNNYEMMLAEALGEAGRTEESYNYFRGLWETHPGDGFINLQLARLQAKQNDVQGAINFYRASIYGDWEGDGVTRRRDVRVELAQYLIQQQKPGLAKTELLVAAGNAPDTSALDLTFGHLLEQAGAPAAAMTFYQKALAEEPTNQDALTRAGALAYTSGDYAKARDLLQRAVREQPHNEENSVLLMQAERLLQLEPLDSLSTSQKVDRILAARAIAKQRLTSCSAAGAGALQPLVDRWAGDEGTSSRSRLLHDSDLQKNALRLIYDTEIASNQQCGAPTGDDALLLLLAHSSALEGASH